MITFEGWTDSYDCFESFIGVNRLTHRDVAKRAWNYQQDKIDKIKKENEQLRQQLNTQSSGPLEGNWANLERRNEN